MIHNAESFCFWKKQASWSLLSVQCKCCWMHFAFTSCLERKKVSGIAMIFFQTSRQCLSETHMASPPQLSLYSCLSGRCRYDDESAKWLAVSTWMHMREKMQHIDLGILQGSDGNFMGDLGNLVGFSRVLSGNSLGLEKAKRLLAIW